MVSQISADDQKLLLSLARQSIKNVLEGKSLPDTRRLQMADHLRQNGASFVTLTTKGQLRGCVGTLEPYQSLVDDVCTHAVAAAFQDYRFPPLQLEELDDLEIEISCLTEPVELNYHDAEDLITQLRPNIDGVIIRDGRNRATFLPQVWKKIPDRELFMGYLCQKMGLPADAWRHNKYVVEVYQVEEFHENKQSDTD